MTDKDNDKNNGTMEKLTRLWFAMSRFWQNMIVGLLIALFVHVFHDVSFLKGPQDKAIDLMIRMNAGLNRLTAKGMGREPLEFTFLEIDEQSFRNWGEPYHIPRDKLLALIRFAAEGGARQVIVDIDLGKAGINAAHDLALQNWGARYLDNAPPLIFVRTVQPPLPDQSASVPRFNKTLVDPAQSPRIHFAHPIFQKDEYDKRVRRWSLYKPGCLDGKPLALPSIQLLAYGLGGGQENSLASLQKALDHLKPEDCQTGQTTASDQDSHLRWGNIDFDLHGIGERIIYTMPWQAPKGTSIADLTRIPAHLITDNAHPPASDAVRGKVVIIGGSFALSHDVHDTPLGPMPGSLIILNAVKSLSLFGQIQPPDWKIKWALEIALIILASFLFSKMHYFWAMVVAGAVIIILLLPASFLLFRHGVWIDFALPLLAIQFHQIINRYEKEIERGKVIDDLREGIL